MEYNDLVELWKKQREQYQLWNVRLMQSAEILRNEMEKTLNLPVSEWTEHETNRKRRYVELVDFYMKKKPVRTSPSDDSITSEGELVFGVSVTFDHGANSYPKESLYVPVAIKFNQNRIEYAFYNSEMNTADHEWTADIAEFCSKSIKRYADYLGHDPHSGFGKRTQMGFI